MTRAPAQDIARSRVLIDKLMSYLAFVAVVLALIPLVLIIADTVIQGASVISLSFLTNAPTPEGVPGGGIGPSIEGTLIMVGLGTLIAVPIGVGAGIFFSEWPESRLSFLSSFMNDVLAEFPSIVIGIFVYVVYVLATGHFGAIAGALALAFIMIPIVARATEASLKLVPQTLREASAALGLSRWKTVYHVVMSTGKSGLITGIVLAIARAAGETAPLLVTASWSFHFATGPNEPIASLPYAIYYYAISGDPGLEAQAWGAALLLIASLLAINLSLKLLIGRKFAGVRAEI
jgi:phosphate transport system permease protein